MSCLLLNLSQPAAAKERRTSAAAAIRCPFPPPVRIVVMTRSLLSNHPAARAGPVLDPARASSVPGWPHYAARNDELDPLLDGEARVENIAFPGKHQKSARRVDGRRHVDGNHVAREGAEAVACDETQRVGSLLRKFDEHHFAEGPAPARRYGIHELL